MVTIALIGGASMVRSLPQTKVESVFPHRSCGTTRTRDNSTMRADSLDAAKRSRVLLIEVVESSPLRVHNLTERDAASRTPTR